jgi:Putative restriction endonuclease
MDQVEPQHAGALEAGSMSVSTTRTTPPPAGQPGDGNTAIAPLQDGDRLTRDEFMRRYEAMPELKKAELISGVVYVPSPVRQRLHGGQHTNLIGWLFLYRAKTPGVELGGNSTVHLSLNSSVQPDAVLFVAPERGGRVTIDDDGYIVGAPELAAEIAASTASYDLHDKFDAFQRNGVREYIVWRVMDRAIDRFVLGETGYERLTADKNGILRSKAFPGLWLDPVALLNDGLDSVMRVLERGLGWTEHADFVAQLQRNVGQASA